MLKYNNKTVYEFFMFGNVLRCDIHHLKKIINSVIFFCVLEIGLWFILCVCVCVCVCVRARARVCVYLITVDIYIIQA